jgi:hypothetical protein
MPSTFTDIAPSDIKFHVELLDTAEAAVFLKTSKQFLRTNIVTKRHPIPYIKVGTKTFYLRRDLNEYLLNQRVDPHAHLPSVTGKKGGAK